MNSVSQTPPPTEPGLVAAREARREKRFPWVLVSMTVALVFTGALSLVKAPQPAPLGRALNQQDAPKLGLSKLNPAEKDSLLSEEAALLDPTPLFLPTPLNAGNDLAPPEMQAAPRGNFPRFQPKLTYNDSSVKLSFRPTIEEPATPAEALNVGERENPFQALARRDVSLAPLPERLGYIEVAPVRGGKNVELPATLEKVEGAPGGDWEPVELLAAVNAAGVIGSLVVINGSGVEEWDAYLRRYLVEQFRLGERLRPGFYRVRVGP